LAESCQHQGKGKETSSRGPWSSSSKKEKAASRKIGTAEGVEVDWVLERKGGERWTSKDKKERKSH